MKKKRLLLLIGSVCLLLVILSLPFIASCSEPTTTTTTAATTAATGTETITPTHPIEVLELRAGQFAHGTYQTAIALEAVLNEIDHPWLRISTIETLGAVENVSTLGNVLSPDKLKKTLIGGSESTVKKAKNGEDPFTRSMQGEILGVFYCSGAINLILTRDPDIKGPDDIIGKQVAFPPLTSSTTLVMLDLFDKTWGILDDVTYTHQSWSDGADALIDGRVDILITSGDMAGDQFFCRDDQVELYSSREVYGVSIPPEDVDAGIVVPAGTFGPHQTESFTSSRRGSNVWWAHRDADPDLIYEFLVFVYENVDKILGYAGVIDTPVRETMGAMNIPEEEFHPGAIRFFKEYGIKMGCD